VKRAAANGEVTRERVRQLEEPVRRAAVGIGWLPTIAAALELLAEVAPITTGEAAKLLAAEGFAGSPFDPIGLLNAARFAGMEPPLTFAAGCLYAGEQREAAARVGEVARKLVSHNGAASVGAIVDAVEESSLDSDAVRRILALDPDITWLDPDREWLFLPTGRNRAANHLRKMLAVARSLSIADVREGFRRHDGREVNLPRNVVRELCKCFNWVRVEGDRISAAVALDYREVLENTEETLVEIFREEGPVLDRATAVDLGEERGLDRTTSGLYLGWSPVIERIAINRYALRGADIPAGTLEAMRGTSPRTRVQRGYGWTSNGRLWVGYTLSQAVIDSHVVGVPSSLKNELHGRFDLAAPNEHLGQLATDGGNLWGLSRLLKRYGAEAGDALVLEFGLSARRVYAFVGGQELLDPENRPEQVVEETNGDLAESSEPQRSIDKEAEEARALGNVPHELDSQRPSHPPLFDPQMNLADAPTAVRAADSQASASGSDESPRDLGGGRVAKSAGVAALDAAPAPHATLLEALDPRRATAELEAESDSSAAAEAADDTRATKNDEREDVDVPDDDRAAPDSHGREPCVVPGCDSRGKHKLGVRCRVWHEPSPVAGKSKTSALWAPDFDAFLCDAHALGGAHITLIYEPNDSGETAIKVIGAPHVDERRTRIRQESRKSGRGESGG